MLKQRFLDSIQGTKILTSEALWLQYRLGVVGLCNLLFR